MSSYIKFDGINPPPTPKLQGLNGSKPTQEALSQATSSISATSPPLNIETLTKLNSALINGLSAVKNSLNNTQFRSGHEKLKEITSASQATSSSLGSEQKKAISKEMQKKMLNSSMNYLASFFKDFAGLELNQIGFFTLENINELVFLIAVTTIFENRKNTIPGSHEKLQLLCKHLSNKVWTEAGGAKQIIDLLKELTELFGVNKETKEKLIPSLEKIKLIFQLPDCLNDPLSESPIIWEQRLPVFKLLINQLQTLTKLLTPICKEALIQQENEIKMISQFRVCAQNYPSDSKDFEYVAKTYLALEINLKKFQHYFYGRLEEFKRSIVASTSNENLPLLQNLVSVGNQFFNGGNRTIIEFRKVSGDFDNWMAISTGYYYTPESKEFLEKSFNKAGDFFAVYFNNISNAVLNYESKEEITFTRAEYQLFFMYMYIYLSQATQNVAETNNDEMIVKIRNALCLRMPPAFCKFVDFCSSKFLEEFEITKKTYIDSLIEEAKHFPGYSEQKIKDNKLDQLISCFNSIHTNLSKLPENALEVYDPSYIAKCLSLTCNEFEATNTPENFEAKIKLLRNKRLQEAKQLLNNDIPEALLNLGRETQEKVFLNIVKNIENIEYTFNLVCNSTIRLLQIAYSNVETPSYSVEIDDAWLDTIDVDITTQPKKKKTKKVSPRVKSNQNSPRVNDDEPEKEVSASSSSISQPSLSLVRQNSYPSRHTSISTEVVANLREGLRSFYAVNEDVFIHESQISSTSKILQMQQLNAIDYFCWSLELWQKGGTTQQQAFFAERLLFWGYLAIEQGLSSQLLPLNDQNIDLFHGISALTKKATYPLDNIWSKLCDRGSLYSRYPFSSSRGYSAHKRPLALQLILDFDNQKYDSLELFKNSLPDLLKDFISLQVKVLSEKQIPVDVTESHKTLESLRKKPIKEYKPEVPQVLANKSDASSTPTSMQAISNDSTADILASTEAFTDAIHIIKKHITSYENEASKEAIALKDCLHHLNVLVLIPNMFESFPEQRYLSFHAHTLFMEMQYFLELFGLYLSIKNNEPTYTHNLNTYYGFELNDTLTNHEKDLMKKLNVFKGLEYPYKFFANLNDDNPQNAVRKLSEYHALAKEAVVSGEGFIPQIMKNESVGVYREWLQSKMVDYAKLAKKLVSDLS